MKDDVRPLHTGRFHALLSDGLEQDGQLPDSDGACLQTLGVPQACTLEDRFAWGFAVGFTDENCVLDLKGGGREDAQCEGTTKSRAKRCGGLE